MKSASRYELKHFPAQLTLLIDIVHNFNVTCNIIFLKLLKYCRSVDSIPKSSVAGLKKCSCSCSHFQQHIPLRKLEQINYQTNATLACTAHNSLLIPKQVTKWTSVCKPVAGPITPFCTNVSAANKRVPGFLGAVDSRPKKGSKLRDACPNWRNF